MKPFKFKLNAVLGQRQRVEREAQRLVAERERDHRALVDRLENLQQVDTSERRDLASRLAEGGKVDARALRQQAAASMQAQRQMRETALKLTGAAQRLHEARAVLTQATAKRRAIELVRDQQFKAWKAAERRVETEALDEMAMAMRRAAGAVKEGAA